MPDEAGSVSSDSGARLVGLLQEALAIADEMQLHFVAAKIDLALGSCPIDAGSGSSGEEG